MKKLALLVIALLFAKGIFAQHINISLQGGFIFNAPVGRYADESNIPINRGLGGSLQVRYQINHKWEAGPVIEYGAVETLYGLSPTFGAVINRKISLKNAELFVGGMVGYLFWQQNEGQLTQRQIGYNIGLHAGYNIPLSRYTALYISAGPRYGKVGYKWGYEGEWSRLSDYRTAITFPVLVGMQFHL